MVSLESAKQNQNQSFALFLSDFCFAIALSVILFVSLISFDVEAQRIRLPKEELAREYVLPVFSGKRKTIINRNVKLKYKLDILGSIIFRSDEPFYHPLAAMAELGFSFSEIHGFHFLGIYFSEGVSSRSESLISGVSDRNNIVKKYLDVRMVSYPYIAGFLNYTMTPFYGKFSISKNLMFNFNFSFSAGGGGVLLANNTCGNCQESDRVHTVTRPAVIFKLAQKIFINQRIYAHVNISFFSYYGPNPVHLGVRSDQPHLKPLAIEDQVDAHLFDFSHHSKETLFIRNLLGAGVGMILF